MAIQLLELLTQVYIDWIFKKELQEHLVFQKPPHERFGSYPQQRIRVASPSSAQATYVARRELRRQEGGGGVIEVPAGAEGSIVRLHKLASVRPDRQGQCHHPFARAAGKGEVLTGRLYLSPDSEGLHVLTSPSTR